MACRCAECVGVQPLEITMGNLVVPIAVDNRHNKPQATNTDWAYSVGRRLGS